MSRLAAAIAAARPAFLPFAVYGDPDPETTAGVVAAYAEAGAAAIELGIPYSDPLADGPVIQAAFQRALAGGARTRDALGLARRLRAAGAPPLVAMVSYALVHRFGEAPFVEQAAAGFAGLIVPDLPFDEAAGLRARCDAAGLDLVALSAPTTPPARRARIAAAARGFLYHVSLTGTTGAREALPAGLEAEVDALRGLAAVPVAVGFGVSTPEQVREVGRFADGVVVGSALVRAAHEGGVAAAAALAQRLNGRDRR